MFYEFYSVCYRSLDLYSCSNNFFFGLCIFCCFYKGMNNKGYGYLKL